MSYKGEVYLTDISLITPSPGAIVDNLHQPLFNILAIKNLN